MEIKKGQEECKNVTAAVMAKPGSGPGSALRSTVGSESGCGLRPMRIRDNGIYISTKKSSA